MPHNYSHTSDNPVVMVRLNAMPEDGWILSDGRPYSGFYHLMQDGTAMIGEGTMGAIHTINSNEIILQTNTDDDTDDDTYDDKDPVYGCTDSTATNYDEFATEDDDSCTYASTSEAYGCTDKTALNYNPDATVDDGSCTYQPEDDDTDNDNVLTGTVAMLSGNNNRIWTLTSYNNSGLFSYAQSGMIATVSNPSQNYFENKIIQEIDLINGMVTLKTGVSGAQYGDSLNFSLDTSQQVPDDEEEDTVPQNPVVEVGMVATLEDGWYFASI